MTIPFIKYSKIWFTVACLTMVVCVALLVRFGLKPGIDFTGGSLLELSFTGERPSQEVFAEALAKNKLAEAVVQKSGSDRFIARVEFLKEDDHQALLKNIRAKFETPANQLREERFETIGAAVSAQLRERAVWAIIFVSLGIVAYMAYAFRQVSRPVASWKYGAIAIVAMIHDIMLVLGIFAALGHYAGVEIDIAFVVALLTVLGYSVNDTIVVFDRIRENLIHRGTPNFSDTVNVGLNETLMRSLNTTLTTLLPLFALYFLGGGSIHYFALALLIGMASGAYSSIFVASPLLAWVERYQRRAV
ncbi:MAG: protein translocase subunit SecF [Candidatus Magasanikbacteria bacterium]|nr:protein translocase subunit SecF [Candidatus Magasanikbacteria bacterium]